MTDPAQAFLNHGNVDQTAATAVVEWGDSSSWVGAKPPTGLGIALLEGSWPEFDAAAIDPATGLPQVDGTSAFLVELPQNVQAFLNSGITTGSITKPRARQRSSIGRIAKSKSRTVSTPEFSK